MLRHSVTNDKLNLPIFIEYPLKHNEIILKHFILNEGIFLQEYEGCNILELSGVRESKIIYMCIQDI